MSRRAVGVLAVAAVGLAAGALLALLPYKTEQFQFSGYTVHCGRPAFAWRTDAVVTGGPTAGTGGASVEREPACGKGVNERLALATGVLFVTTLATAVVAVAGRDRAA